MDRLHAYSFVERGEAVGVSGGVDLVPNLVVSEVEEA